MPGCHFPFLQKNTVIIYIYIYIYISSQFMEQFSVLDLNMCMLLNTYTWIDIVIMIPCEKKHIIYIYIYIYIYIHVRNSPKKTLGKKSEVKHLAPVKPGLQAFLGPIRLIRQCGVFFWFSGVFVAVVPVLVLFQLSSWQRGFISRNFPMDSFNGPKTQHCTGSNKMVPKRYLDVLWKLGSMFRKWLINYV